MNNSNTRTKQQESVQSKMDQIPKHNIRGSSQEMISLGTKQAVNTMSIGQQGI